MGLPLLRDAFETVQAAPIPSVLFSMDGAGSLLEMLAQIVVRSTSKVDAWDSQASRLTRDIPGASKDYLSSGGSVVEIVTDLEQIRDEVQKRLEKTVDLSRRARKIAAQTDRSDYEFLFGNADVFLDYASRMHALMDRDIEIASNFLDLLTITIADIDPDARGGPTFDNTDDLLDYLDR